MSIPITFATLLTAATAITGACWLSDKLYWSYRKKITKPAWVEAIGGLFSVLLLVFVIRSFLYEPFRIPSGSMKPGLLEGDFILVNKYTYGLRFPVVGKMLWKIGTPQRGDVMVFHYPPDPAQDFIKRVIGIPGDVVRYDNKTLYINGVEINQEGNIEDTDIDVKGPVHRVYRRVETIDSVKHEIFLDPNYPAQTIEVTVPEGHYFMMGDNRDHSGDSRKWGFVPEHQIVGKAVMIWLSWDPITHRIRSDRIGRSI